MRPATIAKKSSQMKEELPKSTGKTSTVGKATTTENKTTTKKTTAPGSKQQSGLT
jgi:hypothetical protein